MIAIEIKKTDNGLVSIKVDAGQEHAEILLTEILATIAAINNGEYEQETDGDDCGCGGCGQYGMN